ncbi:hypothetical protein KIL84_018872 [Mauremys mutica]|uniref:Uncharacterized protein n=1 Tax=Mauremys mutica TaxID=74926 RepID=A0A9D3XU28_9SAUR|nr:hypothetical protein KIL84_018872 [Mauremys mutica]
MARLSREGGSRLDGGSGEYFMLVSTEFFLSPSVNGFEIPPDTGSCPAMIPQCSCHCPPAPCPSPAQAGPRASEEGITPPSPKGWWFAIARRAGVQLSMLHPTSRCQAPMLYYFIIILQYTITNTGPQMCKVKAFQ